MNRGAESNPYFVTDGAKVITDECVLAAIRQQICDSVAARHDYKTFAAAVEQIKRGTTAEEPAP